MITSGIVRYEDGRKAAEDYAPAKKAAVELSFEVPEGGDAKAEADAAQAEAMARVAEMLDGKAPKRTTKPKVEKEEAPLPVATGSQPPASPPSAPKEIGNDDLLAAVTKKNAEITDAPRILKMMEKHIPSGIQPKVQNIPQGNRAAFLAELETMSK